MLDGRDGERGIGYWETRAGKFVGHEKETEEEVGEEKDWWVKKAKGLGKGMKRMSRAMFLSPSRAQT